MRRSTEIKHAGPYHAESYSQGGAGLVYIVLWPAHADHGDWVEGRGSGEGGGPSIFTSMGRAQEIENFLNTPYTPEQIAAWKARPKPAVSAEPTDWMQKHMAKELLDHMVKVETALRDSGFHFDGCSWPHGYECDCYRLVAGIPQPHPVYHTDGDAR
jgi:hypothetical protein